MATDKDIAAFCRSMYSPSEESKRMAEAFFTGREKLTFELEWKKEGERRGALRAQLNTPTSVLTPMAVEPLPSSLHKRKTLLKKASFPE